MREFLEAVSETLPFPWIIGLAFAGGLLVTGFCFAMSFFLNRK